MFCFFLGVGVLLVAPAPVSNANLYIAGVLVFIGFVFFFVTSCCFCGGIGSRTVVRTRGNMPAFTMPYIAPNGPFGHYTVYNER